MADPFWQEIQAFEQEDHESLPQPGGVLFLGSSTIRLWSSLRGDFPGIHIINRGFGGSQIEDSIRYVDRIVIPYSPGRIMFYAGDNDLASGKTPEQVSEQYRLLVNMILSPLPQVQMVFISVKPSPCRAVLLPDIRRANSLIETFTKSDDRLMFADVFQPMLGQNNTPRPELFIQDGLHMNAMGYRIWKRVLSPYVISRNSEPPVDDVLKASPEE